MPQANLYFNVSQVGTPSRPFECLVKLSSGPKAQPQGVAVPARPTGQTALSLLRCHRYLEAAHVS
eukprot:11111642-Alexandrium_andersonii.AAC.1